MYAQWKVGAPVCGNRPSHRTRHRVGSAGQTGCREEQIIRQVLLHQIVHYGILEQSFRDVWIFEISKGRKKELGRATRVRRVDPPKNSRKETSKGPGLRR